MKIYGGILGIEKQDYLVSDGNPTLRAGRDLWSQNTVRADDVAITAMPDLGEATLVFG